MSPPIAELRKPRRAPRDGRGSTPAGRRGAGAHPYGYRQRRRGHRPRRTRRLIAIAVALLLGGLAAVIAAREDRLSDALREVTLPLRHEDVVRQQAEDKDLDPALIAAVIHEESRFRDATSRAGAKGLMQIVPGTARFIASRSGGTAFELRDLGTPQVNIAYGSWYLRHLLDRYEDDEELAIAAYNAGARHVDRWVENAGGTDGFSPEEHIGFPETRAYVAGVMERRDEYAEHYEEELGL
ncbi:MAG TPA: lytic transglycosylase domain-containing protein [Thermoleophilaceae bacterium]|nr:lytic transglycosylase domain-containing protein [Thermoleophilaceae bacterium]